MDGHDAVVINEEEEEEEEEEYTQQPGMFSVGPRGHGGHGPSVCLHEDLMSLYQYELWLLILFPFIITTVVAPSCN